MDIKNRVACLHKLMREKGIDVYIVPTADYHQSEFVGAHFKTTEFITGFSGEGGVAVFTQSDAHLWVDGRFFIQGEIELRGTTVELMKMGEPGVPMMTDYLDSILSEGMVLGFDGRTVSVGEGQRYEKIAEKHGTKVIFAEDLVNDIWKYRPSISTEPAFLLDVKYAGETVSSKLTRVREAMNAAGADVHILTTLDDIGWLLNIRGNDIDFFPMVLSYAIVTMDSVELYFDKTKFDEAAQQQLTADGVVFHPYNDIYKDVTKLGQDVVALIDKDRLNYALYKIIPDTVKTVEARNPEVLMKAIKNDVELENIRIAQIKDSIAHIKFMKWIKENYNKIEISEMSAMDKLEELRAEQGNYIHQSFEPISAYGEHAAIIHYTSSPETDVVLKAGNLFLTDTGAGFYEGSTDITRTYALGEVPQLMKDHFTVVATSNLRLANARFLEGANGMNLDIIARQPFWERNMNFNHGTGHGVGYLLNIHEAPIGFRWRYSSHDSEPFHENMIITDEPGIYIEGSHGIRLENELLCCRGEYNEYGQFMYFEPITFIPFDLDAVNPDIMTAEDKKLLNDYHKSVYDKIAPHLNEEERAFLEKYTRAI